MTSPSVIAFGECMVELSRTVIGTRSWQLAFGGDSFNVAAYMARLGCEVGYMTAIGTDEFSRDMRAGFVEEGVDVSRVLVHPERIVGLYAIRVDEGGERSFTYWRSQSAARAFFDCPGAGEAMRSAEHAKLLYLSGITLSLFDAVGRARVEALAAAVRRNGGKVAFDTNYRARGWSSPETARAALLSFARNADILLPTLEDDQALFGDKDAAACIRRWQQVGVKEVAVKLGVDGCVAAADGTVEAVPAPERLQARDTTGAGDSFNAAYLASRLAGLDVVAAGTSANRLAGAVVRHPGALIPKVMMPIGVVHSRPEPCVR